MLGAQSIAAGPNHIVVAGGMESMSNVPHYAPALRKGTRLGHATLLDGMIIDGLWDSFHDIHMVDNWGADVCLQVSGWWRRGGLLCAPGANRKAVWSSIDGFRLVVFPWRLGKCCHCDKRSKLLPL